MSTAIPEMRWAHAMSGQRDPQGAAEESVASIRSEMAGASIDLLLAFFTPGYARVAEEIRATLARELAPGCLAGASGGGVISAEHEIENGEALVLLAGSLPGVQVSPFVIPDDSWSREIDGKESFERFAPGASGSEVVLVLGDPFSLNANRVLDTFHRHAPGVRLVGGMASAARAPGGNALFLNDWSVAQGGFAIALSGARRADVIVSQGCRAIGPTVVVTRSDGNLVFSIGEKPAAAELQRIFEKLAVEEQNLARAGIMIGIPVGGDASGPGSYLIRNLMGHDPKTGALAVGDAVKAGQQVRLHVRDAQTAREDLELLLAPQAFDRRASAALLFSCNGRGRQLYPEPNVDIRTLQEALDGPVPVAGFFCAGEIGPIGDRNFLHGHTASIAILRPA